ncbi:MAG: ACP S-malonyltransferase [Candidatus Dormibacteria bacterium]
MAASLRTALLFPGQGAQQPGMGASLVAQQREPDLLAVAERAGLDLERLLVEGVAEELRPTEVAQPALYYVGVALGRLAVEGGLTPAFGAGHSLGEYSALAVAGALDPADGMELVIARGRLMGQAPPGTMAAVLGLEREALEGICRQVSRGGETCVVANDNSPGQLVISGTETGIEEAGAAARSAGARRVVPLNVGGAFHSPLMAAAAVAFEKSLAAVAFRDPNWPIASGTTGQLVGSAAEVRAGLSRQLSSPVLWTQAITCLAGAGATEYLECGPGNTLGSLVRRISPGAVVTGLDSPASVRAYLRLAASDASPD